MNGPNGKNSMTDVIERLHREFGAEHAHDVILEVVRLFRDELNSVSAESRPQLLERLARQRLSR